MVAAAAAAAAGARGSVECFAERPSLMCRDGGRGSRDEIVMVLLAFRHFSGICSYLAPASSNSKPTLVAKSAMASPSRLAVARKTLPPRSTNVTSSRADRVPPNSAVGSGRVRHCGRVSALW